MVRGRVCPIDRNQFPFRIWLDSGFDATLQILRSDQESNDNEIGHEKD